MHPARAACSALVCVLIVVLAFFQLSRTADPLAQRALASEPPTLPPVALRAQRVSAAPVFFSSPPPVAPQRGVGKSLRAPRLAQADTESATACVQ